MRLTTVIAGVLALTLIGCNASGLEASNWVLAEMNGQPAYHPATLAFTGAHTFEGSTGCNTLEGQYDARPGGSLVFEDVFSTMVACFDPTPQEETAYLTLLNAAATYQISGDTLTIGTASDPAALVFTRDD